MTLERLLSKAETFESQLIVMVTLDFSNKKFEQLRKIQYLVAQHKAKIVCTGS